MPFNSCVWIPVVRKSGRISTMFYTTECGHEAAAADDAKYCHMCGRLLRLIQRDQVREQISTEKASL